MDEWARGVFSPDAELVVSGVEIQGGSLDPVFGFFDAGFVGAVGTAEHLAAGFDAVAENAAAAVRADGGKLLDGAFEAVEGVGFSREDDFERFVVVVAAGFAGGH